MATAQVTDVSICNLALSWLGGNQISALNSSDNISKEELICRANFYVARNAVLELANWSFATKKVELVKGNSTYEEDNAHPGFTAYELRTDVIRVVDICSDAYFKSSVDWSRESDFYWVASGQAFMHYIIEQDDPGKVSYGFVQACAAFLAMNISLPVTGSKEYTELMANMFIQKYNEAANRDGLQGNNIAFRDGRLITQR